MGSEINIFQLLLPLNFGFFGLVFLVIFYLRRNLGYVGWFAIAYWSAFAAVFVEIFHSRFNIGPVRFDDISNAFYLWISVAFSMGFYARANVRAPKVFLALVFGVGYIAQGYFGHAHQDVLMRVVIAECTAGILMIPILNALTLPGNKRLNRVLFWATSIIIVMTFFRAGFAFYSFGDNAGIDDYINSSYTTLLYLIGSVVALAMTMPLLVAAGLDILENYRDASLRDPLTGLYNRRGLEERFHDIKATAKASGLQYFYVQFDLDHFKSINDNHGHLVGDALLKHVSETASKFVENFGASARCGGEEFALILASDNMENAQIMVDQIRITIAMARHEELPADTRVTASFGMTRITCDDSLHSAMKRSDDALYEAKHAGRNCVINADIEPENVKVA